ncbi:MAG: glycosyltransferase family 4 protein [Planctomycetota bacterium]|jgi:glycosyltransferase involved in cell wall biosynthesis|nr:glycosyltransferase family 4 protein [Planctomycetota bacterium]
MDKDKRPIRPLWLLESPNHSGLAVASLHLAAGMCRAGAALEIFALRDGENSLDFTNAGCQVRIFPHFGQALIGGSARRAAAAGGVSLIHALSPDLARRGWRLARQLSAPLVVTANRLEEEEIRKAANFRGQLLLAVSGAIMERLVNVAGIARARIRVVRNGLDLNRIPRPRFAEDERPDASRQAPVIGTLGHLAERKGQRVFLQAVKILLGRGLDAEFLVLGDGPDRLALRNLADELKVGQRVTFTPQTVSGQLSQLDILVEPSFQEGLGVSVMQAMATGVPVVATGVGGLYDLIDDGVTGIMVPAADPEALAEAIWVLVNNPAQRLEMAKRAREKIEKEFSSDLVARELIDCYRECIDAFFGWNAGNAGTPSFLLQP